MTNFMENNIFPTPQELFAFPTQLHLAINDVKTKMQNHTFKFKPEYQTQRYFQEIKALLNDSGWNLTKDSENNWTINQKGVQA